MKKIILSVSILLSAFCVNVSAQHDDGDRIQGSGKIITKDVPVQAFESLNASGVFALELSQGSSESVKIEGDDNLVDLIEVKNEGSTLKISMKKGQNFNSKKSIRVYVSFRNLKSMDLSMVGNTHSSQSLSFTDLKIKNQNVGSLDLNISTRTLDVENNSVGSIKLTGKAESAKIENNGVGSIQAGDFLVQKMDIENSGVGSATVNASVELKVKDTFLGKVTNKGSAPVKKSNKAVI